MAVTTASFLASYPDFANVTESVVDAKVAEAIRRVDTEIWGDKADDGIMLWTAHLLTLSQFGRHGRQLQPDGATPYLRAFDKLQASTLTGFVV